MRLKLHFTKIFIPLFALVLASSSFGADDKDRETKIRVALIHLPPFGMKQNRQIRGIHHDFLKEVFKQAKVQGSFQLLPYKRAMESVKNGGNDLVLIYRKAPSKQITELAPSIAFKNHVLSRKEAPIEKYSDMLEKKIGIVRGGKYEEGFDKDKRIKKQPLQSYEQGLRMLENKRLDGFVISDPALASVMKKPSKEIAFLAKAFVLSTKRNYIYIGKNVDPKAAQRIKDANQELLRQNFLEKEILPRYL